MTFKEVARMYVGCNVMRPDGKTILPLIGILGDIAIFREIGDVDEKYGCIDKCKPILYPLSSLTEGFDEELLAMKPYIGEENKSLFDWTCRKENTIEAHAIRVAYLLSHHFDLFNLIESGEAIDVTTLDKDPYIYK